MGPLFKSVLGLLRFCVRFGTEDGGILIIFGLLILI